MANPRWSPSNPLKVVEVSIGRPNVHPHTIVIAKRYANASSLGGRYAAAGPLVVGRHVQCIPTS
eukprot:scaffold101886_cov35-Attheya_sp.AAC.1